MGLPAALWALIEAQAAHKRAWVALVSGNLPASVVALDQVARAIHAAQASVQGVMP